MRKQTWAKLALSLAIVFIGLGAYISSPQSAYAQCSSPEAGHWHNYYSGQRPIMQVVVRSGCNDVVYNPIGSVEPEPTSAYPTYQFAIQLSGSCVPLECYGGAILADRDPATGWIRSTIYYADSARYYWVAANGRDWLRVYIWIDFIDPSRTDYAIDEWLVRD